MSRKKAARSKGGGAAPSAALPPAAQGSGRAAAASPRGSAPELPRNGGAAAAAVGRPSLSSSGEFYDLAFKVMLVGDSGVGKTCLLVRFKDGAFLAGSFISTVGIDFRNKVLTVDGVKVKLQIWDTAGQERFRSVTHAYYRDAHALLLLYDVTNKASFDNIQAWLTEIHEYAQQDVVLMLLGNKVDSAQDRVVKREDGEKLAKEYGVPFMETSAKSGLNVELAFTAIAKELKHRSMKLPNEPKFKLHDYVKKEVRGSSCCRS
ncbi:ras-related protein Rab-26 [Buteo buteo]|uniref:ras-related protein Rab-26 n=1 Tax=Buteo buteo TaxID=30397 RepID=UPI00210FCCA5|nr:ras-related protein Rab-26 isoform X1 [Accipiter gentilis]XP_049647528.1 ras-related protein Rab-26 isoform X1 [Accipiter gentilis]